MTDGWKIAADARRAYADLVGGLTAEQAETPGVCGDWTTHHVTGHLVSFVDVGLPKFFANMAKHRFNYDRAADTMARRVAERPMDDLVATLRSKADKKSALPIFPGEMTAADVAIHTQDVRRKLQLDGELPAELLTTALVFMTTDKRAGAIIGKGKLDELQFRATDTEWTHGEGELVSGPAESLLMGITGRSVYDELDGPGASTLRDRFA